MRPRLAFPHGPVDPARLLRQRWLFDPGARSPEVRCQLVEHFAGCERLRGLEAGPGAGVNARLYGRLLPCDQEWSLLEPDRGLAERGLTRWKRWAEEAGGRGRSAPGRLEIELPDRTVSVRVVEGGLEDLGAAFPLSGFDLVVATGLFDRADPATLERVVRAASERRTAIAADLNYRGLWFDPPAPEDEEFIRLYERSTAAAAEGDPGRDDRPGRAIALLLRSGYAVCADPRASKVSGRGRVFFRFLLGSLAQALSDAGLDPAVTARLDRWLREKDLRVHANALSLRVGHLDVFAS